MTVYNITNDIVYCLYNSIILLCTYLPFIYLYLLIIVIIDLYSKNTTSCYNNGTNTNDTFDTFDIFSFRRYYSSDYNNNKIKNSIDFSNKDRKPTLQERMTYLEKNTQNIQPTSSYIIRLNINKFGKFKSLIGYETLENKLLESTEYIFQKFKPSSIYVAGDEMLLIFPLACENHPYNGNINKLSSLVVSYVSSVFNNLLIDEELVNDFIMFNTQIAEFKYNETYELLNYVIWRMNEKKRKIDNDFTFGYIIKKMNNTYELGCTEFFTPLEMNDSHFNFVLNKHYIKLKN